MADERETMHEPISGEGAHRADDMRPGSGARPAYPASESDYWREQHLREPYFETGLVFEDYGPAYELGWVSHAVYGSDFDVADSVLANDWELGKGRSSLSWDEARLASRAAWQRAENARSFVSDGSASREQAIETLQDLRTASGCTSAACSAAPATKPC